MTTPTIPKVEDAEAIASAISDATRHLPADAALDAVESIIDELEAVRAGLEFDLD